MQSFWYFFTSKAKQCENDIIRLRKVLDTLTKTRDGAKAMKQYIKQLRLKCQNAEQESEETLKDLIQKTTLVEKLKAKLGIGSQLLLSMQLQDDSEATFQQNNLDDDKLLKDGNL
jgi:hypothetical protein